MVDGDVDFPVIDEEASMCTCKMTNIDFVPTHDIAIRCHPEVRKRISFAEKRKIRERSFVPQQ
jgi:hypothetical protein